MADDRIDVIVTDKIVGTVAPKLKEIAKHSRDAYANVRNLNTALAQIKITAVNKLTQSATAAAQATSKAQIAASKLAVQQNIQATSANKLAVSTQKLNQQQSLSATKAAQAAQAQARAAQAHSQAASAAIRQQQALLKLNQQQQQSNSLGGIGSILSGVSLTAGIFQIVQLTDAYQRFEQRVDSVTKTVAISNAVQEQLYRVANLTYTAVETQGILFQRFDPIMARYGQTIAQTIEFQTNLSKAISLSGATASETQGALIQLAQAASGNFKTSAQELNSILEQAPKVAEVFAQQIGISQDQLKKVAKEGELSTKDLIAAFSEGGKGIDELQRKFMELNPTITQATQNFTTNLQRMVGSLGEVLGSSDLLVDTIFFLSQNMYILAAVGPPLFILLATNITKAAIATGLFNTALYANPLIAGGAILAGAVTGIIAYQVQMQGAEEVTRKFNVAATNFFIGVAAAVHHLLDQLNVIPGIDLDAAVKSWAEWGDELIKARNEGQAISKTLGLDFHRAAQQATGDVEEMVDWFAKVRTGGENFDAAASSIENMAQKTRQAKLSVLELISSLQFELDQLYRSDREQAIQNALRQAGAEATQMQREEIARLAGAIYDEEQAIEKLEDSYKDLAKAKEKAGYGGSSLSSSTDAAYWDAVESGTFGSSSAVGPNKEFAAGGSVWGPGTGTSDSIPAYLSNGEFVVNAASTSKFRGILEAINNSPIRHFAEGGYAAGDYSALGGAEQLTGGTEGSGSFQIGGSELDDLMASGFSPYIGTGGHSGGWDFTGIYSPEIEEAFLEQSAAISQWQKELRDWWQVTEPSITDATVRSTTDMIVDTWMQGLPKYTVDPREYVPGGPLGAATNPDFDRFIYHFEDVVSQISKAGYTASILGGAPPWGDTVGNYLTYTGPAYGTAIAYGGEIGSNSYAAEAAELVTSVPQDVTSQQVSSFFDYGEFEDGGRFTVQGTGGTDSSLVQFRATPGEEVAVSPKGDSAPTYNITIGKGAINVSTPNVRGFKESENEMVGRLANKISAHLERIG